MVKKAANKAGESVERKGGGGTLSRTEIVTIRLDPKLRYLAELAARSHRRTLSSWIEWSIKTSIDQELLPASEATKEHHRLGDAAKFLWDVDEPGRLAQLAFHYPSLLTFEEQVLSLLRIDAVDTAAIGIDGLIVDEVESDYGLCKHRLGAIGGASYQLPGAWHQRRGVRLLAIGL